MNNRLKIKRVYVSIIIFIFTFLQVGISLSFVGAKNSNICAASGTSSTGASTTGATTTGTVKVLGGSSCVSKFPKCDAGYINVIESLNSGKIKVTGKAANANEAVGRIQKEVGADANKLCMPEGQTQMIQNYASGFDGYEINFCPNGWVASKAPESGGTVGGIAQDWGVVGCCPSKDYQLVTRGNIPGGGPAYQGYSICCKIPAGATYGGPNYPWSNNQAALTTVGECLDKQATKITTDSEKVTDRNSIDGKNFIITNKSIYKVSTSTEPTFACPDSLVNGCAAPTSDAGTIINPSAVKNDCSKCFATDEAIKANLTSKKLTVCTGEGSTAEYDFINGNINDTMAYIAAQKASGQENANQLKSCRESGGIYIAIGCVDPTPLGILTGLIRIAFGIMGGVALAQLIYAGVMYQSGDEAKIAEARGKVMSTIAGIAVLVFSVLILRIIGVNVLDILPAGAI